MVTYDFDLRVTNRDVTERTLPDLYLEHLYSTGLSLDNLRVLLGGVDEKLSVDEILEDEEQKEKAEKYIKEFLRADLISSSTHKTSSQTNVDPDNSDKIDGGVYIWRTSDNMYEYNENTINDEFALQSSENPQIKKMIFVPYDVFHTTFEEDMGNGAAELDLVNWKGWLNDYTINEDGNIEVFVFNLSYEGNENVPLASLFGRPLRTTASIATIDYKEYIKQYTEPFEFLMATAYTCENPEYAYHLAFLARETMIDLVICDEYSVQYSNYVTEGYYLHTDRVENQYLVTTNASGGEDFTVIRTTPQPDDPSDPASADIVTLGASTTFNLTGNVDAFVVRANAWDKYLKTTLVRSEIVPEITEDSSTGLNEVFSGPTAYSETPSQRYPAPTNPNAEQYEVISGNEYAIMTAQSGTTRSYRVEYETRDIPENGDSNGNKYKAFYGLLRAKEESKAEDTCEDENDVIEHIRDIETDENGYNTYYKLQKIGMDDKPINIMANERDVLYRQIEAFGNAFHSVAETGERELDSDDDDEGEEENTSIESNGTNYDWLYEYLDEAFKDFHSGKFQELETLPEGFGDFFGTWNEGSGGDYSNTNGDGSLLPGEAGGTGNYEEPSYTARDGTRYHLYNQHNYPLYYGTWNNQPCTIDSAGCGMTCAITIGLAYGRNPDAGLEPTYTAHWHRDLGGTDYQNWINTLSNGTAGAVVAYYYNSYQMFNAMYNREAYTIMYYAHGGRYRDHWLAVIDYKVEGGTNYLFVFDPAGRVTGWKAVNDPYFTSFGYISYCIKTTNPPPGPIIPPHQSGQPQRE